MDNADALVFDREALLRAAERGGPPTSDDVTVLADGTRIDTPAKARQFAAQMLMERAGVSGEVDPSACDSDESFSAWLARFTSAHPVAR